MKPSAAGGNTLVADDTSVRRRTRSPRGGAVPDLAASAPGASNNPYIFSGDAEISAGEPLRIEAGDLLEGSLEIEISLDEPIRLEAGHRLEESVEMDGSLREMLEHLEVKFGVRGPWGGQEPPPTGFAP